MRPLCAAALCLVATLANAQDRYLVDWEGIGEETLNHLSRLIQIDTTNPPGKETLVVDYLREALEAEGVATETYALDPERANLVARVRGNGSKKPILIMGHTDVVGVQADKWDKPPFSGLREDGWLYGRGSLDDKDTVAAGMMVILMLERYGVELDRDVIFLAEAGEEGTPDVGINFMVENHWDAIAAEYCLAEGGGGILEAQGVKVVEVQTTEKVPRRVTLVARGTAGHGSRPSIDNPIAAIARAVAKADAWQTEMRLNDTTRTYFERLASVSEPDAAFRYRNIENPDETDQIQQHFLENDPTYYSTLRTSVVPTIINGGFRRNVIPSEATAMLDIRMLPDEDVEAFYTKLGAAINEPTVEIVPEAIYRPAAPPSGMDNEMFEALERVADKMYPDAVVLPKMSTGATDMSQVRAMGVPAYGIGPIRSAAERNSGNGAHSDNERVSEAAMIEFLQFMWSVVIEVAASQ
jgi:acetylornithine deacetylase/succinyl-diaminopimelate desuccinylase-like protein